MFILSFLLILVAILPITLFSIVSEKIKFNRTLEKGLREFEKAINNLQGTEIN